MIWKQEFAGKFTDFLFFAGTFAELEFKFLNLKGIVQKNCRQTGM